MRDYYSLHDLTRFLAILRDLTRSLAPSRAACPLKVYNTPSSGVLLSRWQMRRVGGRSSRLTSRGIGGFFDLKVIVPY